MKEVFKFRKSVHGYNKQDVIAYISALCREQEAARSDFETEMDRMKREVAKANERAAMAEAKADELATELYSAEHRETELKRAVMGLSDRIKKFEDMRENIAAKTKTIKATMMKKGVKMIPKKKEN